jgi:hypothetical protein
MVRANWHAGDCAVAALDLSTPGGLDLGEWSGLPLDAERFGLANTEDACAPLAQ